MPPVIPATTAPRVLRTADAARYLGLSASTLNKLRVTGGGPDFYKIGRAVVYSIAELDRYLASCVRRSTSDKGTSVAA